MVKVQALDETVGRLATALKRDYPVGGSGEALRRGGMILRRSSAPGVLACGQIETEGIKRMLKFGCRQG